MSGRGKGKASHAFTGDLIALGSKSTAAPPASSSHSGSSSSSVSASKKVKPLKSGSGTVSGGNERLGVELTWENIAEEVEILDLVNIVEHSLNIGDTDRAERVLCGSVKVLRSSRAKPDMVGWMSLLHLAKKYPDLFSSSDYVRDALCSLLKRDMKESFKSKGNSLVSVLAANVLFAAFQDVQHWPDQFLKVYIDDAMGERLWVDHSECRQFTDNILTAFNTILLPAIKHGDEGGSLACPSPPTGSSSGSRTPTRPDDEVQVIELPINKEPVEELGVFARYTAIQDMVEQMTVAIVKEQLNRRSQSQQNENITKNFIRFLTFSCGLPEVRLIVASKLEMWLINPKISRPAQELLRSVCLNCTTSSPVDIEVMISLIKQRLKTKQTITLFLSCLKDLCGAHPDNLSTLLKHTIFNELSQARNPNNMPMLGVMFQVNQEKAAEALASVYLELLLQKENYLPALRILLKEIVSRCVRQDINLSIFCHFLMNIQLRDKFEHFKEFEFKERMFSSLVDLITMAIFLTITPQVREAFSSLSRGERKDMSAYKNFLMSVSFITRDTLRWFHDVVPKTFKPDPNTFSAMLYKSLFMTQTHDEYFRHADGFPKLEERDLFFKLTTEVPVQQETLLRIFLIGLAKNLPLNGQDCLTIAETLIKRAAGLHMLASKEFPILTCDKAADFMECVWQLTAYTYPESISLPPDYTPPSMAITASYWKAWQMLLIMTAYNPEDFGTVGWKNYPTLRALMEMCITNQFIFPPPTTSPEDADDLKAQDLQVANIEKQQILEFESQLAAASSKQLITEQNSLLLATITSMNPLGSLRRPPQQVLDQLKQINAHYKIGHLLCRSRKPDFLLDILQRQGTNQAMPWLADLVENSEGSFSVLPVQCLCEFLLNDALALAPEDDPDQVQGRVKKSKAGELLLHLQQLLQNPNSDPATCLETLDYFLARLASVASPSRLQALAGLRMLLTPGNDDNMDTDTDDSDDWLLHHLPALPCFPLVYRKLSNSLRQACQVETDPATVSLYIRFLAQTCPAANGDEAGMEDLAALALELAPVIVERIGLLPAILPGSGHIASIPESTRQETYDALLQVYYIYMMVIRQKNKELERSENQEFIYIQWASKESATLHLYVVHAQIILLTYGSLEKKSQCFDNLLEMWFPRRQEQPRAFSVETGVEIQLIQDWIRLKMIRSSIPVLVDSALRDLDSHKVVVFIQSFGIPTQSMSKLLKTLDVAVQTDFEVVNDSVPDKAYMGQLVSVQHKRGAEGGFIFAKALNLNLDLGDLNTDRTEVTNVLPELNIPPRATALMPSGHVKTTILNIFEVGSHSTMSKKERQDDFRTLQKLLSEEFSTNDKNTWPVLDATVSAMLSILQSKESAPAFVQSMRQRPQFGLGLVRLLTAGLRKENWKGLKQAKSMLDVCKKCLKHLSSTADAKSPLHTLLNNYINDVEPKAKGATKDKTLDDGQNIEEKLQRMAHEALKKGDTKDVVSMISSMLLEDNCDGQTGLLVDWLELLDPTIISTCPDLQMKLVFGKKLRGAGVRKGSNCRPYLLSLLTHQASYTVLRSIVSSLLSSCDMELEPSAVLDFLSACVHIPRLWKGRDQRPPRNYKPEDVLCLDQTSLTSLVDYIVCEAVISEDKIKGVVKNRIDLLLRCLVSDKNISIVVKHLINLQAQESTKEESKLKLEVLRVVTMSLYMNIPGCFNSLLETEDMEQVRTMSLTTEVPGQSVLDAYTHTLLSALAATQMGKHWAVKMQEYELCARKIMSSHPVLFLRNLPLLSSSLRGRTQYEFVVFRSCNHLTLFTIALGLLELARPHVFSTKYREHLEDALGCYMDMIDAYLYKRDSFIFIIDRLAQFLISWKEAGGNAGMAAASFMRNQSGILLRLSSAPGIHKIESVKTLMATITFHSVKSEDVNEDLMIGPVHSIHDSLDADTGRLLAELTASSDSSEKLLSVLHDIQTYSNPKPGVLLHFQGELMYHMSHSNSNVRTLAFSMLVKHLKQRPQCWKDVMPGYLGALQSGNQAVVSAALSFLPEFAVYCQENLELLLTTVFKLNMSLNMNTSHNIVNAINMVNTNASNSNS